MPDPSSPLSRAVRHIARRLGDPPSGAALIVASPGKRAIALALVDALHERGLRACLANPDDEPGLAETMREVAGQWALACLLDPAHAPWLFGVVGRPDRGILLPREHLFCDWMISADALVRLHAVDPDEVDAFRSALAQALAGAQTLHVTTPRGTDLLLAPRQWVASMGEIYTAPVEESASGLVCVDGAAYGGPVTSVWRLEIRAGSVANLADLDQRDPQQRMAHTDLTRDAEACGVAEFGLGVNPGARLDADIMEAEQARGTCHIGFGHNLAYGGRRQSATHTDYCLLHPTILADGRPICREGRYTL